MHKQGVLRALDVSGVEDVHYGQQYGAVPCTVSRSVSLSIYHTTRIEHCPLSDAGGPQGVNET